MAGLYRPAPAIRRSSGARPEGREKRRCWSGPAASPRAALPVHRPSLPRPNRPARTTGAMAQRLPLCARAADGRDAVRGGGPEMTRKALLLTALLVGTTAGPTMAYDNDTHYYLTYFIAVKVGYTPAQALRIAAANVGIDYDAETEPLQKWNSFLGAPRSAQIPRMRFHAFPDYDKFGDGYAEEATEEIRKRENGLWGLAAKQGNPGPFIHFHQ